MEHKINFMSGIVNGLTQVIISYPFDTFKIKYQTDSKIVITYKNIFKGIKYPIYTIIPIITLQFSLENYLSNFTSNRFISGAITGIIVSPIVSITDLYRIREQHSITNKINITNGIDITLLREMLAISVYFGSYNTIKNYMIEQKINESLSIITSGGICGSLSWTLTYPIDVIKSRIQSNKVYSIKEGYKKGKLWKGLLICNIRSILINSIGFFVYEKTKDNLNLYYK